MRVEDILVDCLTFPIATGQEETRRDGSRRSRRSASSSGATPTVQTTLGLSNISFGLNPAARHGAQLGVPRTSASRPASTPRSCTRRRSCRWRGSPRSSARSRSTWSTTGGARDYDPLQRVPRAVRGRRRAPAARQPRAEELLALPLDERLERRIIDGERNGLEADLDEALGSGARPSTSSTTPCWTA